MESGKNWTYRKRLMCIWGIWAFGTNVHSSMGRYSVEKYLIKLIWYKRCVWIEPVVRVPCCLIPYCGKCYFSLFSPFAFIGIWKAADILALQFSERCIQNGINSSTSHFQCTLCMFTWANCSAEPLWAIIRCTSLLWLEWVFFQNDSPFLLRYNNVAHLFRLLYVQPAQHRTLHRRTYIYSLAWY